MILPHTATDWDYACVDLLIGVGLATVGMAAAAIWQEWVPKNKNPENNPEDEK